MSRFYFNLISRHNYIPDEMGKELKSLNDAYEHARKLIDSILFHVGPDDEAGWVVKIFNDEHNAQLVVPFPLSEGLRTENRLEGEPIQMRKSPSIVGGTDTLVHHAPSSPK